MITTNTNNTKRKSNLIITAIACAMLFFALPFSSTAQTIFTSGFEAADAVLTYNSTTGTAARINSLARTGTWRGGFTANGTYDGCAITPLLNFVAGNTYTITVYSRAMACTGKLQIYKNLTATNAAMKASTGGDILLSSAGNNVISTAYVLYTASWVCPANESKYVGFQMIGTGGGACGAINLGIDDILITQTVGAAPCAATGNNFCSGAWAPTLNGSCCSATLSGATDNLLPGGVGCQIGSGSPEVWFSGTAGGGLNQLQFTVSGLGAGFGGDVELIVMSASGACSGLTIAGSSCGPAPLSYNLVVVPGTLYYWVVSSSAGSTGPTATFNICVTNNAYVDNTACNINDVLNATPAPTINANFPLGTYPPATTVQFDYTITGWDVGASCNWLAGIVPSWGTGWDPASFTIVTAPVPAAGDLGDTWSWWTAAVIHNTTGANINPSGGWFYCNDNPGAACTGTNTDIDWGDGCIGNSWGHFGCNTGCDAVAYAALSWNVSFRLTTRATVAACVAASSDLSVNVKTYADGEIGSWTSVGCMADMAATEGPVQSCCIDNTTPLTWTGLTTAWAATDNWGSCILPTCTNDVVIPVSGSNATITTAVSCRDITINAGATLLINAGGTLSICGNFINNGTVTCAAGSTVIFVGTAAQSISGSTTTTFANLIVNNTSATGLTLSTPANVSAALTLTDGIVYTTATNILSVLDNATSTPGTATVYVDGWMRKVGNQAFVFPLGDGTKWARLGISAPIFAADAFTATYNAVPYATLTPLAATLENVSSMEHWICNRTAGTTNVFVTLFWESGAFSGINTFTSDLHVARFDGTTWQDHGSATMTGAVAAGSVRTAAVVTAFSPFTFSSISGGLPVNPLPIELLSFTANYNGQSVDVNWNTATEINNDYFDVERSTDAENFISIKKFASKAVGGNSTASLNYAMNDVDVTNGVYYYRLKQTDLDGSISYSGIVSVTIENMNAVFTIKPNPTTSTSEIIYYCSGTESASINVYDARGRLIISKTINCVKGENLTSIDLGEQPDGLFYITLTAANNVYTSKLLKSK